MSRGRRVDPSLMALIGMAGIGQALGESDADVRSRAVRQTAKVRDAAASDATLRNVVDEFAKAQNGDSPRVETPESPNGEVVPALELTPLDIKHGRVRLPDWEYGIVKVHGNLVTVDLPDGQQLRKMLTHEMLAQVVQSLEPVVDGMAKHDAVDPMAAFAPSEKEAAGVLGLITDAQEDINRARRQRMKLGGLKRGEDGQWYPLTTKATQRDIAIEQGHTSAEFTDARKVVKATRERVRRAGKARRARRGW